MKENQCGFFCKKELTSINNKVCVEKKIARTKKTTKRKKCLESPFLFEDKIKKQKNAMQPKSVGRQEFILVYCFLKDSRKY